MSFKNFAGIYQKLRSLLFWRQNQIMNSVTDLILKKGPLSSVWIAGTSTDKLGKKMILATDISTLAKQIMEEERVNLVLRLSGMLLKGLVVVYSKKMQYMLTDCEDVISKIKLSFKPGQIDLTGKNSKDETITITTDISDLTIEPAVNLEEWAKTANPEEYFVVQHPKISFQTAEPSQVETDDSAAASSFSSQVIDTPIRFNFDNESLGNSTKPSARQTPSRQIQVPETTWDDVDDIPIPADDDEPTIAMPVQSETDATTEPETEEEKTRKKKVIIDNQTMLSNNRRQTRRTRRTVTNEAVTHTVTNSQLDSLFSESRQRGREQSDRETNRGGDDFESDVGIGLGGFDSDAEIPEVETNRAARVQQSSEMDNQPPMPSDSDIIIPSDKRQSDDDDQIIGMPRPVLTPLASPFPNLKFVVEETPRRTAEDSFTHETINTLNKFRDVIRDKEDEKTTFSDAFSGSSRRQAARAFYQMLVLKSTGQINVKQDEPFGEIEITPGKQFWST